MWYRKHLVILLVVVALAVLSAGCPGPARKPGVPGGPGGLRQEPTISLFINETGEKKNIKIEEYLEGVVAAEMDPSWEINALAAQAILARTFTMKKIQEGGVRERGVDASTDVKEFQAYAPEKINDRVRQAVRMTRGEVVTYKGNYINGWFHADGGGKTAASANEGLAFKKEPTPYIKSVKDPGFNITVPENKSWTARFPAEQVRAAVKQSAGQDPGSITEARVVARGPSGRATTVRVGSVTLSAPALRLALGNDQMRSTLLSKFAVEGGALVVSGRGYGHGVGMSQWGARAMAQQGKKPEDIVNFFFRGVIIEKRWQ
ncbi:stage II sporulation protein SpoIID [Clostridiales bacterium PH28_bin88]|nr:stage II sporulation protein SpoIID [Clostridiales bacterium PH28_bin88]